MGVTRVPDPIESNIRGSDDDDLKALSDQIDSISPLSAAQTQSECEDALAAYTVAKDKSSMTLGCYPSAAAAATVTTGETAWSYAGASWVEIIAASTISNIFYLNELMVSWIDSANKESQIQVGVGGAGSESVVATVGNTTLGSVNDTTATIFNLGGIAVAANARVAIRATDIEAAANNIYVYLTVME